jgi:hypothetical protein
MAIICNDNTYNYNSNKNITIIAIIIIIIITRNIIALLIFRFTIRSIKIRAVSLVTRRKEDDLQRKTM